MKKCVALLIASAATCAMAQDQTPACLVQLQADSRIQVLAGKLPVNVSKGQPLELLASRDMPTADEKAALSVFASELDRCFDLGDEWRRDHSPANLSGYVSKYHVDTLLLIADLYSGKLSYGDVAKARAKQFLEFQTSWNSVVKDAQAQRAADDRQRAALAQQQEAARRQAALAILANQRPIPPIQLQPLPQLPTRPTSTTNCHHVGDQLTCTTN